MPESGAGDIAATLVGLGGYVVAALGFSTIYRSTVQLSLWQLGAEALHLSGIERLDAVEARDVPAHAERGRAADRHMEVGRAERDHLLEQVIDRSQRLHRPSTELSARLCEGLSPACHPSCEGMDRSTTYR
jgi:hypothetical protein